MVTQHQRVVAGGMAAFSREPSGRRASTIGDDFVEAAPERSDQALDQIAQLLVVVEVQVRDEPLAAVFDRRRCGAARCR